MFKKPLRVKNQSVVKKSDRKQVLELITRSYPAVSTEILRSKIFADGEDITCLKAEAATTPGTTGPSKNSQPFPGSFFVFCDAKKQPYFVSFDVPTSNVTKVTYTNVVVPTVYLLWRFPSLLPLAFTTIPEVLLRLKNGAKLMIAGADLTSDSKERLPEMEFLRDCVVFASLSPIGSTVPVGIGRVLMSSDELKYRLAPDGERKGEVLEMVHFFEDELWALGDKSLPPEVCVDESTESNEGSESLAEGDTVTGERRSDDSTTASTLKHETEVSPHAERPAESPDDVFRRVFLIALKSKAGEAGSLPMLASTLNKHMIDVCRRVSDDSLDIKRTTYKKFGKFLEDMQTEGLVAIAKIREGVEAVSEVSFKHEAFRDIEALPDEAPEGSAATSLRIPSVIRQVYIVNGKTAPIFQAVNPEFRKGHEYRSTDAVREVLTQYIKTNSLASATDKATVNLDKPLVDILMNKSIKFEGAWPMKWSELFEKFLREMSTNHEVVFTNGSFAELKGKFVPMEVKVEKKAGNKLVTVIRHLEGLGMDPQAVARELQQSVGATVGVREEGGPNNPTRCVTVQGDQTKLLDKFFFQTFSMPKKFVTGLEKPGKKG